ncbi:hypothetical protein HK105_200012 [Polyrhizophydium stewartii]|uniref:CBS-domain-containing protein n=1 Tax=Polyrhizophydium stewartii TaxID=2732419 RepID=A0ABR4NKA7_9FUNG|nr:hypothetical protein HK105_006682 [Polyrhizophydium stewartii]
MSTATVQQLRPTPAVPLNESVSVLQAAGYMAAKRCDALLVVDNAGELAGIVTDKDIAYRVVAAGLVPRTTPVAAVMTPHPVSVAMDSAAGDALNRMVAGRFRHLPVVEDAADDGDDLLLLNAGAADTMSSLESLRALRTAASPSPPATTFAVLDITKCLYEALDKLERALDSSAQRAAAAAAAAVAAAEGAAAASGKARSTVSGTPSFVQFTQNLRDQLACPSLGTTLDLDITATPMLSVHCSVLEAVQRMKAAKETAVLVFEPSPEDPLVAGGSLAGIFTTKDLVLRVLAGGMDPATTPIARVMTPHPDCVTPETTIIDALKKMYSHRYLHLPIVNDEGVVCGMADVLKLTYSILAELTRMENGQSGEGPLWNKFWEAASGDRPGDMLMRPQSPFDASESSASQYVPGAAGGHQMGAASSRHRKAGSWEDDRETILPDDSASVIIPAGAPGTERKHNPDQEFVFKFKDDVAKKTHRFSFNIFDIDGLRAFVASKIANSAGRPISPDEVHLCYLDDEGDSIHLANSRDLEDAVIMARSLAWKRLVIMLDRSRMADGKTPKSPTGPADDRLGAVPQSRPASSSTGKPIQAVAPRHPGDVQLKDMEVITPLLLAAGLAVAGAFLLGKAFR